MIYSAEEKAVKLKEFIESIKDIVVIEIPTVSGLTPRITNVSSIYVDLCYNSASGFLLSTSGRRIEDYKEAQEFSKKLLQIADIAKTLNSLYKKIK